MTNNKMITLEDCDRLIKKGYCVSLKIVGKTAYLLYSKND